MTARDAAPTMLTLIREQSATMSDMQITIGDRLFPGLRSAAVALEVWLYRAEHRWNRHQMIADGLR